MQLTVDNEQLPVGWEIKYLDKLCENLDSKRVPITKASRKSGNIPYYGASGIVDYVADYIFDEDLLLVSEDGANLLARTYPIAFSITGKTWVNNHAHVLRFKEKITQSFIEYYLNSISLEPYVSGMAQPKLNQKSLNSIAIPFPPLSEQKRIVVILDEGFEGIDRAIANTEKNLANSRELFESYLNAIFTQKGDDWTENKLGDVCTFQGGSQPPKAVFSTEKKDGYIRLIQIRDYKSDNYTVYIPKKDARRFCQPDDVMIGRYGPPLFQILRGLEGAYNVALMKAIPNEQIISKDFLFYFLQNKKILNYIINPTFRTLTVTSSFVLN
ncbi:MULTISPECIES: restriction endonuclease subunit S [unclassified Calothrix]|uniref:restriction endonuclease subunit S n=1 Tax=unclassified Calothrix TaxID=2619626 RepID=UPI001F54BDF9|nr:MULTISPECIES: restriction endonuclease subunit S [unclassified Calothrix]